MLKKVLNNSKLYHKCKFNVLHGSQIELCKFSIYICLYNRTKRVYRTTLSSSFRIHPVVFWLLCLLVPKKKHANEINVIALSLSAHNNEGTGILVSFKVPACLVFNFCCTKESIFLSQDM